jgi:hypothetical protein
MILDENDELKTMLHDYLKKAETDSLSFDEYSILINMHISHLMIADDEDEFSENKMQQYTILGWYVYKHILKK